jgi:uncharacterized protein (TIGR01319 family)
MIGDIFYLLIDINNQKTRVILVGKINKKYCIKETGASCSTINSPLLDVMIGVENAISSIKSQTNLSLLQDKKVDFELLCTSNVGGGLHMMVAGLHEKISTESAQRASLGAGANLMGSFSMDDKKQQFEKIEIMRNLKPDIFLLSGGTDGGEIEHVAEMASLIEKADIKPRFGAQYKLPVIYAGNVDAIDQVLQTITEEKYAFKQVENVRPSIEHENLGPAKEEIYDMYMHHVIIHSPGFEKLAQLTKYPILPTQAAIGKILHSYALEEKINLLGVDLGGATTDVYSIYHGKFNRTLNADLGLNYSILNILKETGSDNIMRWLPQKMTEKEVRNTIANIMILQPKEYTKKEIQIIQATAREAIRLGLIQHKKIASPLKGTKRKRTISDFFEQEKETTYVDLLKTDRIFGKSSIFTLLDPIDSVLVLIDALQPEGFTEILIDKNELSPFFGALSVLNNEAAVNLFKDNIKRLCYCISPKGQVEKGNNALNITMTNEKGDVSESSFQFGDINRIQFSNQKRVTLDMIPHRKLDIGKGKGKNLQTKVYPSILDLIIDLRGRPFTLSKKEIFHKGIESVNKSIELWSSKA